MNKEEINKINRERVFSRLNELGIATATAGYHGSHKEGHTYVDQLLSTEGDEKFASEKNWPIASVPFLKMEHKYIGSDLISNEVEADTELSEAIKDLTYELLDQEQDGWDREEGSEGQMIYVVADKKIQIKHTEFSITFESSEKEI